MRIMPATLPIRPKPRIICTDTFFRLGICNVCRMKKGVIAQDQSTRANAVQPK